MSHLLLETGGDAVASLTSGRAKSLTPYYASSDAMPTSLFFSHNQALVPPYRVIVDTNFINLSLENRVDMVRAMMDVLYAKGGLSRKKGWQEKGWQGEQVLTSSPHSQQSLASPTVSSPNWKNWDLNTGSLFGKFHSPRLWYRAFR